MELLRKISPLFSDLIYYKKTTFRADLLAGLTVGVMLIPQGMAYAVLTGLPPIYGLYGGLIPLIIYALLGTSRHLSVGPVAVSCIVLAQGLMSLGYEPFSEQYVTYAIIGGLFIGILQFLFGFFKLGAVVSFLSRPVNTGFTAAVAIIIFVSQLKDFLGIAIPRKLGLFEKMQYAAQHISEANWIAVALCLGAMLMMYILKKVNRKIPGALLAVIIGILFAYFFEMPSYGLAVVGDIPSGLPSFEMLNISKPIFIEMLPVTFAVAIISIIECIGIGKSIEAKHDYYHIKPSQELMAIGLSKIGGAFFQSIPTSGSFTRSAVNSESGAKTQVSSLFTAAVILLTLLFLTPIFYYLPKAILAAIILMSIRSLVDIDEIKKLWNFHKTEFALMLVTFFVTLFLGIEIGVMTGVLLSIINILIKSAKPRVLISQKEKKEAKAYQIRLENQLYFANAAILKKEVKKIISEKEVKKIILDASCMHDIDSSGVAVLQDILKTLKNKKIDFYICGVIPKVQNVLEKTGFSQELGSDCFLEK